jgi:hypothetical protein
LNRTISLGNAGGGAVFDIVQVGIVAWKQQFLAGKSVRPRVRGGGGDAILA